MAESRNGDYRKAEEILRTLLPEGRPSGIVGGTAAFYQVMALLRLGRSNEARTLFSAAEAAMKRIPTEGKHPLEGHASTDHLILWLAYKEAKALLSSSQSTER